MTRNHLQSIGLAILATGFFGGMWLWMGLYQRGIGGLLPRVLTGLGTAMFLLAGLGTLRQARRSPRVEAFPFPRKAFAWINGITYGAALPLACALLAHAHKMEYFTAALVLAVALHLIPLGWALRSPGEMATGVVMTLFVVAVLVFAPAEHMPSTLCFGCALLLWHSAAWLSAAALANLYKLDPSVPGS